MKIRKGQNYTYNDIFFVVKSNCLAFGHILSVFPLPGDVSSVIPVGKQSTIKVDASDAGEGHVTARVAMDGQKDFVADVVESTVSCVAVIYVPKMPGVYNVKIGYGGQPVPHGQFKQQVSL